MSSSGVQLRAVTCLSADSRRCPRRDWRSWRSPNARPTTLATVRYDPEHWLRSIGLQPSRILLRGLRRWQRDVRDCLLECHRNGINSVNRAPLLSRGRRIDCRRHRLTKRLEVGRPAFSIGRTRRLTKRLTLRQTLGDLFAIARSNADAIRATFDSLLAQMVPESAALTQNFADWVEAETSVAINVKLYVLINLLNGRVYQNIYEWADEQSRLSGRAVDDILRERLREFYERRITFDRAFDRGEEFRYGELSAGAVVLREYGPYSLVLTRSCQCSLDGVAYLPGDSLKIAFADDGSFVPALIERSVAPSTHYHLMVTSECANEIPAVSRLMWPELIASPSRCFEVVFIGEISLDTVDCVRVLTGEYDRQWDMAFANFGRELDEAQRALVNDFVQLCRGVRDGRVRLEVL